MLTAKGADDYWIYDLRTGQSLRFNDLHIHLIRDHGFFEGHVYHRLEPLDIIHFFDLKPCIDYAPIYLFETQWVKVNEGFNFSSCNHVGDSTIVNLELRDQTVLINVKQIKEGDDYYETDVDQMRIKHQLANGEVSKYEKRVIKYVTIGEEMC